MKISSILAEAGGSIVINKGRSLLTILGVVIGIAAVTAIIGLGEGVDAKVDNEISKLGSTNITIESRNSPTTEELAEKQAPGHKAPEGAPENQNSVSPIAEPTLTKDDLKSIAGLDNSLVMDVSPLVQSTTRVKTELGEASASLQGVSETYGKVRDYEVASGSFFTQKDVDQNTKVAVLGKQVATNLFGKSSSIGKKVSINNTDYLVVGVLAQTESGQFENPDATIFAPYSTVIEQNQLSTKFGRIIVSSTDENSVNEAKDSIEAILLKNHSYDTSEEANFSIKSSAEMLDSFTSLTDLFRKVLTGAAAISLLVGGIGIMNIMLVSVTERTREIGLRKAVGAKTRHILMQFLAEAIVLTLLGGLIGVFAGQLLAAVMTAALDLNITPSITIATATLAVSISVGIGIVFGIYPAMKAAKLDPIDALRYE
ncbi:ABC transporter permease [Candidatus Saccharibacteria bacterium]|nr:ABC transporter permease [Candidatus Saccharibacteria bacterium]MBP9131991.1 ABC transporter permease [Candidatus Saccharibacteria bacterium]